MELKRFKYLLVIITVALISCSSREKADNCHLYPDEDYIPVDLYDAVEFLNCLWSKDEKQKIVRQLENNEEYGYDNYMLGQSIRNSWGLWTGENDLVKFFNSHDITHPDDMSSIILTSFQRKFNNKEIDFEDQVQTIHDNLRLYIEYSEKETKRVLEAYDKYELGDTITLYLEVITHNDNELASYSFGPFYEWTFDYEKDLKLRGKITQKEIFEDGLGTNVGMYIHVLEMNKEVFDTAWKKNLIEGDTMKIELKFLKYE